MKNAMILGIGLLFTTFSCEKNDHEDDDVPCAVVASQDVPSTVVSAFDTRYSGRTVVKWYNKDSHGFSALFDNAGIKTLAEFNNDGTFVKEEIDEDDEEEDHKLFDHEDDDDDEEDGCECEMD